MSYYYGKIINKVVMTNEDTNVKATIKYLKKIISLL